MEQSTKYCANCHSVQLMESKFCSNCAHNMSQEFPNLNTILQNELPRSNFFYRYKELLFLVIFALLFSGGGFAFYYQHKRDMRSLNSELLELHTKLDDLKSQIKQTPAGGDNDEIISKLNDLETDLSNISDDVTKIKNDVSDVQSDVNSIESDVSSIQLKIGY